MIQASDRIQQYFTEIESGVKKSYEYAAQARAKGCDPSTVVDVKLAKNLAERVVGLISVIAPQVAGSGIVERIIELEAKYGTLDWRVAMQIGYEIAIEKFVKFKDKLTAIEIGIRVGFAYVTVGVVSSPLEGFTSIEIKRRRDNGKEFFTMNFAGPVRNAGGTAAAVSVLIADYIRKRLGYATYDPDDKECERCYVELMDYHERITNLQYVPSKAEVLFMVKNCPIEISGDASEDVEVSSLKDLPRIKANRLRSGYCLIHSSCIPLKAPKLWKNISKWIDEMDIPDWKFLEEFLNIQKNAKSSKTANSTKTTDAKIYPIYTYMVDLVGGRPVISHPLRDGGLRLRYGRSRVSGFSAQSIHPATMFVLDNFIAIATQLKVERPGKAAAYTSCDTIDGPVVLLEDGSVHYVDTVQKAKQLSPMVKKILYLGDILINYGDFFDRAHTLVPAGYCQEWWIQEFEKAAKKSETEKINPDEIATALECNVDIINQLFKDPLRAKLQPQLAFKISKTYNIPLHPSWTPFWRVITAEQCQQLLLSISTAKLITNEEGIEKLILYNNEQLKTTLEKLAIPHSLSTNEFVIIQKDWTYVLFSTLNITRLEDAKNITTTITPEQTIVDFINTLSPVVIRDKAGVFVGARMGRPEKAKMRKIAGHPYGVPPQSINTQTNPKLPKITEIVTEHAVKAQLRQKYEINANKDGTIRYDASEVPITHFKPKEIDVSVSDLIRLGYKHDIHGVELTDTEQILELLPQDIVIPCCTSSPNEPSDEVLFRVANYIDELLVKLYGLEPFYKIKNKHDLVGMLLFGLAPHTSAAITARVVGFSKTQGFFCHPMLHAAMRRDCDGDESCFFLLMDGFLNFSTKFLPQHRGGTMDAPLVLTSIINPTEVDDMVFNVDIAWKYPLEFYEACRKFKKPWEIKIKQVSHVLGKPEQFEGSGFTHDTSDFNEGVLCSAYKTLPSMAEKVEGQMRLAEKISAVDPTDVAQIVIDKHFLRDIMGNLRKFSQQEFRCIKCNNKFRRPPISGRCNKCQSMRIVFTVNKASIIKYLELSIMLGKKYNIAPYTKQCLEILKFRVDGVFGKEREKQAGLADFLTA